MNKNILTIDMCIIMHRILPFYQHLVHEFDPISNKISEASPISNYSADLEYYHIIINDMICRLGTRLSSEKIHFVYGQEDIIHYLNPKDNNTVFNIDYFCDCGQYLNILNNSNWIKYCLDKNLISKLIWIPAKTSNLDEPDNPKIEFGATLDSLNPFALPTPDELIISLSEEWITPSQQPLIDLMLDIINTLKEYNFIIEEYSQERKIA